MTSPELDPLRAVTDELGVFLRAEAIGQGYDDKDISRSLRAGVVTRVRHGSYVFTDTWASLTPGQRHVLLGRAVMRRVGGVALSHTTAALAHGLDVWDADLSRAHVTRLDGGAGRTEADLVHHEGVAGPDDLVSVLGVAATTPVRAALETATLLGTERGMVTASSGLRLGLFDPTDLARQHDLMQRWGGAQALHLVTRLADGAFESVGEVRTAYLLWRQGVPRPTPQLEVYDAAGRFLGRVDFAWERERLILEFDGRTKYLQFLRPGESPTDAVLREKRREDALREAGWMVIRATWDDLRPSGDLGARIRHHLRHRPRGPYGASA